MVSQKLKSFPIDLMATIKELGRLLPLPFETPYQHLRRIRRVSYRQYYDCVRRLNKRGTIKIIDRGDIRQIQLTREGYVETLLSKFNIQKPKKWDGYWRLVIFDIPEKARHLRNKFRWLLKKNKFYKLQASVFISPHPLNREAIEYLKETGLIDYIRILKVSEIDDDRDLKKRFRL